MNVPTLPLGETERERVLPFFFVPFLFRMPYFLRSQKIFPQNDPSLCQPPSYGGKRWPLFPYPPPIFLGLNRTSS